MNFRDRFKEYQLAWLTWIIMLLVSLGISLFFGVNYPIPDQPDQPPEPVELGTSHFSGPIDITDAGSASAPALIFEGDADTGLWRSAANTLNVASGGSEMLEIDSSGFTVSSATTLDVDGGATIDGGVTNIGGGSPSTADGDNDLYVTQDLEVDNVIDAATNVEHLGLPSVLNTSIITSTDGALWTIADGELWFVWNVFCNVTTNFDCTGDDCALHIGDGNDEDGFLDLDDAELQASDTEITGAQAGWQGLYTDTTGAYLAGSSMTGFIYAPSGSAETIDIKIEDTSDNSDPTAGAATCYLVYTRLQ